MTAIVHLPAVGKNVFDLPPAVYTGEFRFYNHVSPSPMTLQLVCNGAVLVSKMNSCALWTETRVSLLDTHFPVKASHTTPVSLRIQATAPDPLHSVQAVIAVDSKVDAGERERFMVANKFMTWTSGLGEDNILVELIDLDENKAVRINYTNYRGETAQRQIIPLCIQFKASEYHKEPQWLMTVYDLDKKARREMAIKDMTDWTPQSYAK